MREMKDSGVEWIGKIPAHWEPIRFRFIAKITTGNQDTQNADPDGEFPFYVRSPIVERCKNYTFDGEGILMAGDGAGAGRVFHLVDGKYAVHQRVYRFYDFKYMRPVLLKFYLENLFATVMDYGSAKTTVPSVRLPMIQDFVVCVPPDEEQISILSYLINKCSQVDALIANVQTQIEKLKAYKQSLITEVVTKGLDPTVPTKDSGVVWIGEIPEHWEIAKLRTRTQMLTPMRDKPEDLSGPIPWVRIEDYCGKYITASKEHLGVTLDTVKAMNLKIYPVGTVLCTSSCDLGKCAVVGTELVSNQRFIGIIPTPQLSSDFLYYLMLSNAERLNTLSTGSIQANLSRVSFEQLQVQFPPWKNKRKLQDTLTGSVNLLIDSSQSSNRKSTS